MDYNNTRFEDVAGRLKFKAYWNCINKDFSISYNKRFHSDCYIECGKEIEDFSPLCGELEKLD